jgi:hypothetical protein
VKPALHQNARAAERDGFVNAFTDFLNRMNVCVGFSRSAIKRAERADDIADVRVIDVAVNDVSDDVGLIFPHPDLVRRQPDADEIVRFEQRGRVLAR